MTPGEHRPLVEFVEVAAQDLAATAAELIGERAGWALASIVADAIEGELDLLYLFRKRRARGWKGLRVRLTAGERTVPSIVAPVHAADWHEREIEDLFGVTFAGHPRLGDFVLHDEHWPEKLAPMRVDFDLAHESFPAAERAWKPHRILQAAGAFTMPVGPVYSGVAESALFLLETLGEDVLRAVPRLFYKYRAVEKIVEGRRPEDALLRVERCSGRSALAHAWAFAQAIERLRGIAVGRDAELARAFFAELERYRHHVASIREICESTSTLVATSQSAILEEELLRVSAVLTGHRYFFGAIAIGGVAVKPQRTELDGALRRLREIDARLGELEESLRYSSGFLDRIEEVGIIAPDDAVSHGLVGPLARASASTEDLRRTQPYGVYASLSFDVPSESEGDGYARLRVLFAEAKQSLQIMEGLAAGSFSPAPQTFGERAAIGWTEAPRGASLAYVRLHEDGTVARLRLTTPSFSNWLGFYLATEQFAFQDFPIILATLDLSAAESDR
jgi:Ni,Fe-hydrogenase III large subunit/Ni,Fe-hydrogenase III component G